MALLCVAGGVEHLWRHWRDEPQAYRAASGLMLVALGFWQALVARHVARRPSIGGGWATGWPLSWRWMFVGCVAAYGVGLALGPEPNVKYLCRAVLAGWYTLALVPLAVAPATIGRWRGVFSARPVRFAARLAVGLAAVAVVVEAGLRAAALVSDQRLAEVAAIGERKLTPGTEFHGRRVNRLGYWDEEFVPVSSAGRFRIAALGQRVLLSGTAETNCLAQIERRVPGVEVYNFGLAQAGPRDYAAQLASDVSPFRPDLVLAFISAGADIAQGGSPPGMFDWRSLSSVQWGARYLGRTTQPGFAPAASCEALDYESYLRSLAPRLAVCRTPIDATMRRQWEEAVEHLDDLVRQCRKRHIAVGLVLVPSEFQVNAALCEALRRRTGYEAGEVDLDLPQRRLARFAHERNLPVIDLLPHFRASGESPYCRRQGEFSDQGNEIATRIIGGWLQARFGTQIAALAQAAVD